MVDHDKNENEHAGLGGGWIFLIIVIILLILSVAVFFLYFRLTKNKRQSAREAGGFTSSSSNPLVDFFQKSISSLRNKRSQTGAGYEGTGYGAPRGGAGTGRAAHGGPLDPDEAWDSRVGNESEIYGPGGYYEETELGLHPQSTAYTGAAYGGPAGRLSTDGAGFAPAPGLSAGGGQETRGRTSTGENPFGDHAEESSLRSISPRPFEHGQHIKQASSRASSPTGRRSLFKEDIS